MFEVAALLTDDVPDLKHDWWSLVSRPASEFKPYEGQFMRKKLTLNYSSLIDFEEKWTPKIKQQRDEEEQEGEELWIVTYE